LRSAIRRHHPPQRAVLSQIFCFGERKVVNSDPVGRCWAMWCEDDLVVFSSLPSAALYKCKMNPRLENKGGCTDWLAAVRNDNEWS